jgi:hypothetical protein
MEVPNISASPEHIKSYVLRLHDSNEPLNSNELDTMLLGTTAIDADTALWNIYGGQSRYGSGIRGRREVISKLYPNERAWDGSSSCIWTPYDVSRALVHEVDLCEDDTFYDLGAGYGRLVLYAGITAVAACKGIEMVNERVQRVQSAIERLEIDNAKFIGGKVQDHDYSDGDVFYMYAPFSEDTYEHVFDRLEEIGNTKPITIINRGGNMLSAMNRGRFKDWQGVKRGMDGVSSGVYFYEHRDVAGTPESRVKNPDLSQCDYN